jgi:hypothetical protein
MAAYRGSSTLCIALCWLLLAASFLSAQNPPGALAGRLTDLHSHPLSGVTLTLRNQSTGLERQTLSGKNGVFLFSDLPAGTYSLAAASTALGRGELQDLNILAGQQAHLQTAMDFALPASATAQPILLATAFGDPLPQLRAWRAPSSELASSRTAMALPEAPYRTLPLAAHSVFQAEAPRPESLPLQATLAALSTLDFTAAARELLPASAPPATAATANTVLLAQLDLLPPPELAFPLPLQEPAGVGVASPPPDRFSAPSTPLLTGDDLRSLPAASRNWQSFLPALSHAADSVQNAPEIAVDGVRLTLAFPVQNTRNDAQRSDALPESAFANIQRKLPLAESAIQSLQSAEGGSAAPLRIETLRGGHGWHGQGFLFDHQPFFGAQNPFTQWSKETTKASGYLIPTFTPEPYTPPDQATFWGFGIGHTLHRDHLFWFAALDGSRRNDPGVAMVKHPYLCAKFDSGGQCIQHAGFFAQPSDCQLEVLSARLGLAVPGSSKDCITALDEAAKRYSAKLEALALLLGPAPRTAQQWVGFARADWPINERNRLTVEGSAAWSDSPGGGLTRTAEAYGLASFGHSHAADNWMLGRWEHYLSANLLATSQFSFETSALSIRPETPSPFEQSLLADNQWGQLPQIVIDSSYGFTIGNPARFGPGRIPDERQFLFRQQLDWARSTLLVRSGFELRHSHDATSLLRNQTGSYTYSSVYNFISDALAFDTYQLSPPANQLEQPYCDQTGKVWTDRSGAVQGYGQLPCYTSYTQTLGPSQWWLGVNDWAGYSTAQWQPAKKLLLSAGLRWEREETPPALPLLANSDLPQAGRIPALGNQWEPRLSLAWGRRESHWPLLRLAWGDFAGRTANETLLTLLTHTGSTAGDLHFYLRPTDNLNQGGAPTFPAVLTGPPAAIVKPSVVEMASGFRNPRIQQAEFSLEEQLPAHLRLTAAAQLSLGRKLPVSIDTNIDPAVNPATITYAVKDAYSQGPIHAASLTVPFYATWSGPACTPAAAAGINQLTGQCGRLNANYQQIDTLFSRANSTWQAFSLRLDRSAHRGLMLHLRYTYAHATDWNPEERLTPAGASVYDPARFDLEYGSGDLDIRHALSLQALWHAPWKLHGPAGRLANGWMLAATSHARSGLPYTMRISESLPREFPGGSGAAIVGVGPGSNGYGGDNRLYGVGSDNQIYNIGRNTYRYPWIWKADLRLSKSFNLGHLRQLELLAESFNLFNHSNVTQVETTGYYLESGSGSSLDGVTLPTLNFMNGVAANTTAFGQPLNVNATSYFRERMLQFGMRIRF